MNNGIDALSSMQKFVLATSATVIVLAIFLHNPTSGYITMDNRPHTKWVEGRRSCTEEEKIEYRRQFETVRMLNQREHGLNTPTDETIDKEVEDCTKRNAATYYESKPISEWTSTKPIVPWFGLVFNLAQFVVLVAVIGYIFIFTFKEKDKGI